MESVFHYECLKCGLIFRVDGVKVENPTCMSCNYQMFASMSPIPTHGEFEISRLQAEIDRLKEENATYEKELKACYYSLEKTLEILESNTPKIQKLVNDNAALKAESTRQTNRGDCHAETLRAVRDLIQIGDYKRAVLWIQDGLSGYVETNEATLLNMSDELNSLRARLAKMDETLRWYGDENHYKRHTRWDPPYGERVIWYPVVDDKGQRAREAIK